MLVSSNSSGLSLLICLALSACSSTPNIPSTATVGEPQQEVKIETVNQTETREKDRRVKIQSEISELQTALDYLETDNDTVNFIDGSCTVQTIEERLPIDYPDNACSSDSEQMSLVRDQCNITQSCDLVAALVIRDVIEPDWNILSAIGCGFDDNEQTILTSSGRTLSDFFCVVGAGKIKNKWANLLRLGRSAACAYSIKDIADRSDRLASCINTNAAACDKTYKQWASADATSIENHELRIALASASLDQCKRKTKPVRALNDRSATGVKNKIIELENSLVQ